MKAPSQTIGTDVQCAQCKAHFVVPTRLRNAKIQELEPTVARQFQRAELEQLQAEDPSLLELVKGATNKNCWEFLVLAGLIERALQPLDAVFSVEPEPPKSSRSPFATRGKYVTFIDRKCGEFLAIQHELCRLLSDVLQEALYADDIALMFSLAAELAEQAQRLIACHEDLIEKAVPDEAVSMQLFALMQEWAPHCWQAMSQVPAQLRAVHERSGAYLGKVEAQLALVPPNIRGFFACRDQVVKKKILGQAAASGKKPR